MWLDMKVRHRLTDEVASSRYRGATREQKRTILDEFVVTTGYNRKYAIHLFARWGKSTFLTEDDTLLRLAAGRP